MFFVAPFFFVALCCGSSAGCRGRAPRRSARVIAAALVGVVPVLGR